MISDGAFRTTYRHFRTLDHLFRIERTVVKISGHPDSVANDFARRDDILPAHVRLSIGAPLLLVSGTGASPALAWDVSTLSSRLVGAIEIKRCFLERTRCSSR